MAKVKKDKQIYTEVITDRETGEAISSKTVYKTQSEPEYVKLYLDCVFAVKGVRKGLNPIFVEFLEYMSYADTDDEFGGQIIFVNKALKMRIAKRLGLTIYSIDKALSEFVKSGLFKRVAVGTYQVNPSVVGKGDWKDIKNIKATFDFGAKEIVADIVHAEENNMTENQQQLEQKAEEVLGNGQTVANDD